MLHPASIPHRDAAGHTLSVQHYDINLTYVLVQCVAGTGSVSCL